jgi:hypothetical protein
LSSVNFVGMTKLRKASGPRREIEGCRHHEDQIRLPESTVRWKHRELASSSRRCGIPFFTQVPIVAPGIAAALAGTRHTRAWRATAA